MLILIFLITISSSLSIVAQERAKDTIDDQVVNVVTPYKPTISDAFKIKDTPKLQDSNLVKKKEVKYNIFSIPVASTFTPAKGKAATVDKAKAVKLYDNYASLGVGTYTSILGEVYLNHELSNSENVGGYFSHHSSQGGIEDLLLDGSGLVGDVNQDGFVNVLDVVGMLNYILGILIPSNQQYALSDINQDDILNILDVVLLVNIILE